MNGIPKVNVGRRDPVLYIGGGNAAVCAATGKQKFLLRSAAQVAKKRVKQRYSAKVRTYLCAHCDCWHLTSKPKW